MIPTYESFRKHAVFTPDIKDFGVCLPAFKRLLAESGFAALGGLHYGDVDILANASARKGYLTFDQACRLAGVLLERLRRRQQEEEQLPSRCGSVPEELSIRRTAQQEAQHPSTAAARVPATPAVPPSPRAQQAHATGPLAVTASVRPSSAPSQQALPNGADRATTAQPPIGQGTTGADCGGAGIEVMLEPPVLLRESIPPPACPFKNVRATLKGIMVLLDEGETSRARQALNEVRAEWQVAMAQREAQRGDGDGPGDAPAGPDPSLPLEARVWINTVSAAMGLSACNWEAAEKAALAAMSIFDDGELGAEHPYRHCLLLCRAHAQYGRQQHETALVTFRQAKDLAAATARSNQFDMLTQRNIIAAHNNESACLLMLGRGMEAVRAYQRALADSRAALGPDAEATATVRRNLARAVRCGLGRRRSIPAAYARVASALISGPGACMTSLPKPTRLIEFIRQRVVVIDKAPVMPVWATKVTLEDGAKAKQGAAKKAPAAGKSGTGKDELKKGIKKAAKDTVAKLPASPPHYGLQNINLPKAKAKKGRKKKKA